MSMKVYQSPFIWIFAFTVLFMLSLDFWRWKQDLSLAFLNFPDWLFYFIGLNFILVLTMYGFIRLGNSDDQGGEGA